MLHLVHRLLPNDELRDKMICFLTQHRGGINATSIICPNYIVNKNILNINIF